MSSCTTPEVLQSFAKEVASDGFGTQEQPDPNKYVRLPDEEVGDFLQFVGAQQQYNQWVVLAQAEGVQPNKEAVSPQDEQEIQRIQNYTSGNLTQQLVELREMRAKATGPGLGPGQPLDNSLENWQQDWTLIDREQFVGLPETCTSTSSFFDNWPSFNVADKLIVVSKASGAAFTLGFTLGIQTALRSLYDIIQRPIVATGAALVTALGAYLSPQMFLTAVGYVAFGGVIGGTAMAAPVFIVGSTGVFAAAGVYHSYTAAKRLVVGKKTECSSAGCSPSTSPPTTCPLSQWPPPPVCSCPQHPSPLQPQQALVPMGVPPPSVTNPAVQMSYQLPPPPGFGQ